MFELIYNFSSVSDMCFWGLNILSHTDYWRLLWNEFQHVDVFSLRNFSCLADFYPHKPLTSSSGTLASGMLLSSVEVFQGRTCSWKAPSGGLVAAHTQTPLTASEIHWRKGERGEPTSLQSGWRSWSPQTPEVKSTDITPLIVKQTSATADQDENYTPICQHVKYSDAWSLSISYSHLPDVPESSQCMLLFLWENQS